MILGKRKRASGTSYRGQGVKKKKGVDRENESKVEEIWVRGPGRGLGLGALGEEGAGGGGGGGGNIEISNG